MKRMLGGLLTLWLAAGCSGSSGTGGSTGSTGTAACGAVTLQGSCSGDVATFCYAGDLPDGGTGVVNLNCASDYAPPNDNVTCSTIDLDYGVNCAAKAGTVCGFLDSTNQPAYALCAGGPGAGCVLGALGPVCQTNLTPCSRLPDAGAPPPQCVGSLLQFACHIDQPIGYDCASYGGNCSNTTCINLAAGAPCDLPDAGERAFFCASNLSCVVLPDGGFPECH
jgi:hypothetical protein